jgi:hypothetical protein
MSFARNLDLVVLVLALPVFLAVGAPIAGYLVAGGAWLVGRFADEIATRRRRAALEAGNRNAALGVTAASMLGRLWILAGAILVVGLIEREAGLAAAILAFALVTAHLSATFVAHLLDPEGDGR